MFLLPTFRSLQKTNPCDLHKVRVKNGVLFLYKSPLSPCLRADHAYIDTVVIYKCTFSALTSNLVIFGYFIFQKVFVSFCFIFDLMTNYKKNAQKKHLYPLQLLNLYTKPDGYVSPGTSYLLIKQTCFDFSVSPWLIYTRWRCGLQLQPDEIGVFL